MPKTALVTGGTGGLGRGGDRSAARRRLARRGPVDRRGRARAGRANATGWSWSEPICSTRDDAAAAVRAAASDAEAPLRAVVNLVGGFDAPGRVHEVAVERFEEQFRLNLRATYLVTQAALPHLIDAGGGSIVCVGTRAAVQPFPRRGRLRGLQGGGARVRQGGGGRVPRRRRPLQRDPAQRDRHARQPRRDAGGRPRPLGQAGGDRRRSSPTCCPTTPWPTSGAAIPVYGRA